MALTVALVKRLAKSAVTYYAGYRDYRSGGVTGYQRDTDETQDYIWGKVTDERYEQQDVGVGLDPESGNPKWFRCSCSQAVAGSGLCRHGVALLLYHCDQQTVNHMMTATDLMNRQEGSTASSNTTPQKTDFLATQMLGKYREEEAAHMMASSLAREDRLTAQPHLSFDYNDRPQIYITVGNKRPYIVKDMGKFCSDMMDGRVASYGKGLEFVHHMQAFTEESQRLVQFVLDKYEEYQRFCLYTGSITQDKRFLPLSPASFDQFFEMYDGQTIEIREKDAYQNCTLVSKNPSIDITVRGGGAGFSFSGPGYLLLLGEGQNYLLMKDTLYRCDQAFSRKTQNFLSALQEADGYLYIAHKDMPAFCADVLPVVQGYLNFCGDLERLESFSPDSLEVELYLDAPTRNKVTAKVVYRYGEVSLNPYDEKPPEKQIRRDPRGEFKMKLLTQKYFNHIEPDRQLLYFEGGDEEIYHFVVEGLPALMQAATIQVTDRFSNMGVIQPPNVSVGVRLESDLLEMEIDTGEFPLEELTEVLHAYRLGQKYYRLTDGRFMQLEDNSLSGLSQLADGLELGREELRQRAIRLPRYRALYLDRVLGEQEEINLNRDRRYRNLLREMKAVEDSEFEVPHCLVSMLRNYQKVGFRWLKTMERYGFGGILADDMGLGKTLQVIALLVSAKEEGINQPSLIVAPTSLVFNWESELHRFAPQLRVCIVAGDTVQRRGMLETLSEYDVAVTSYDLLKRDIPLYESLQFHYHIIDEAQYIKNHTTQNAKAVKAVQSRQRFALTGTPVENRLSELWSIFDFLMPGLLYSYNKFREKFELPIVKNRDEKALEQLSRMILPFVLRRLKKDVLKELPSKTETVLYATLTGEQRKLYLAYAAQARQQLMEDMEKPGPSNRMMVLSLLTRMRQICCDPSLCLENYSGGGAKEELCVELIHNAMEGGHKVLLFSQFTSMLSILEKRLEREGIRYYILSGSTSRENRLKLVNRFNRDDTQVFLISLKAGGTGLNLTAADVVIHYDPWWNLSAQNQATDRAHRIGQKNSVQVFKLIAKDTVEEKICKMQEQKQELAESVIQQGDGAILRMSGEELMQILE